VSNTAERLREVVGKWVEARKALSAARNDYPDERFLRACEEQAAAEELIAVAEAVGEKP
jgi:predicted RNA-binding Zn ribbon-like protein